MEVVEVDPADESMVAACHGVEVASVAHDRPHGRPWTLPERLARLRGVHGLSRTTMWAAVDGGRPVGMLEVELQLQDNLHLAELMIHVLPARRGQGIGGRLHELALGHAAGSGRTTLLAPVETPLESGSHPGMRFAVALGYRDVHVEHRLERALPAAVAREQEPAGYGLVTWHGGCPEQHVAAYCLLRTQMESDVPLGDVAWERATFDPARLRADEERVLVAADLVAAIALTEDGEPAAYSWVTLPHGSRVVDQEDTLVMPDHRGHGLARALKLATLAELPADRDVLSTFTDPGNTAMYGINEQLGFRPVEAAHEMQRELG